MSQFPKMTARQLVYHALQCAISDRLSFADCWDENAPERVEALDDVCQFRTYMKRRFGTRLTYVESALEGSTEITLEELRARHEAPTQDTTHDH